MESCDTPVEHLEQIDYHLVESRYKKLCSDLDGNISMEDFLGEFNFIYAAFNSVRLNEDGLKRNCEMLQQKIEDDTERVRLAVEQAASAQQHTLQMKAAMENAFRMVDEAHAMEQEAQEALVTAEKQIKLLKSDIEQSTRAALENEEGGSVSRSQGDHKNEKESLDREVADLKIKLAKAMSNCDELERKNLSNGAKMDTMAQHLEVLSTELGKEMRLRESLEIQQVTFAAALTEKENEIKKFHEQLNSIDNIMFKNEALEAENKVTEEQMSQELEFIRAKAIRAQQDYEAQLIKVERLSRETSQKAAALKARDEEVQRVKQEAAKCIKGQEWHFKRLAAMEAVRQESEHQKEELRAQIIERERETDRLRKQAEGLKKKLDTAIREKELIAKNLSKSTSCLEQQVEKSKHMDQMEKTLRNQLHERDQELSKQKAQLLQLERECKRLKTEFNQKEDQCEATCEQLKEQQEQRLLARKQMLKLDFDQKKESVLLESLRFDKENLERQLVAAKARVDRFEEKIQEMETKGVQLKESIIGHETSKMKDELVLQKAEREKESARHELRQVREQLASFRERALTAEQEQKGLQEQLNSVTKQKEKLGEDLQELSESQSSLKKRLKAKEEEVRELRGRIKELEKEFTKANQQYDLRVEEIRLLKLKVQNLANENRLIALDLTTRDDNRQQIFRLQRDLTEEQLKRKALEDELAQPKNVHRWRYLQGEDPERFELIQRLSLVQKRLIYGLSNRPMAMSKDNERRFAVHSAPPASHSAAEMLFQLRHSQKQIKGLVAEKMMYQSQAGDLRQQVHQLGLQLQESKKKLFAQKRRFKKQGFKLAKPDDSTTSASTSLQPVQKVRFTGGGFNLNVTPQDSRLSD